MKKTFKLLLVCIIIFFAYNLYSQEYLDAFKLGSSDHEEAHGMYQDNDGNIYLCGNFENSVDFDPGSGEAILTATEKYDAYIAKYDAEWNYIWAISITGPEWIYGRNVVVDENHNVYVAGYFKGLADFDPGPEVFELEGVEMDGYLAKYDQNGNFMWAFDIGNEYNCTAYDVIIDQNDDIWLSGIFKGEVDFDPSDEEYLLDGHGFQDAFLAKYNTDGQLLWAGEIGGTLSLLYLPRLETDNEGNVYFTSYFDSEIDMDPGPDSTIIYSAGNSDLFVLKLDTDGNYLWGFSLGGALQDQTRDIVVADDHFLITGFYEETIDFDPSSGEAIFTATDNYDAYIASYTLDGEYLWAIPIVGNGVNCTAQGQAIYEDNDKNIYLTGSFYGTVDFDPSTVTYELVSQTMWDIFTAKYDQDGNFEWANFAGGNNHDYGQDILLSLDQEEVMVCGKFQSMAEFDHVGTGHILGSSGGFDAFLVAYTAFDGAGVDEANSESFRVKVYPNPASDKLHIDLPGNINHSQYTIYTQLGSILKNGMLQGTMNIIDIAQLNRGVYYLSITSGSHSWNKKIVVN